MNQEEEFWLEVVQEGLPRFRFLRRPFSCEKIDRELFGGRLEKDWERLKEQMQPGDEIWPFELNVRSYLGLRRGYAVVRGKKPVGGIVIEVS
jgi:hypothetical protein